MIVNDLAAQYFPQESADFKLIASEVWMISGSKVFVVIPAFRAEKTIAKVLSGIPDWVDNIIVVDDCSPDQTADTVKNFRQHDERVLLIQHTQNQGVGGAVVSGYLLAVENGADLVVKLDSDGQMDPAYMHKLIAPHLSGAADYTKGNRFLHEKELMSMPYIRRIGNLGLSFLTKIASGYWNIFDPTNGYTAISAEALRSINVEQLSRRYFFETSMLLELGLHRMVVRDIDIPAIYGVEKSNLSTWKSLFEFPPRLLRGMLRRITYFYFIRDFTAITLFLIIGICSILFGSVWGIYHWYHSAKLGVETSTGTVMIAILPLILGIQFLIQAVVMDIQNIPDKNRWNR